MPAYKDSRQGTWYASFYFENWQGVKQKKLKRGFATKKDALAWEREFLLQQAADLTMTFEAFVEIYITDKKKRLRENTWSTKEHIIRTKILPYFKEKRLSEIKPRDVIAWQNEMLNHKDEKGQPYSPVYLKTVHKRQGLLADLPQDAAWTTQCHSESRRPILRAEIKRSIHSRVHGVGKAQGDALLDKRRVPQIRRSHDGQAAILLCV